MTLKAKDLINNIPTEEVMDHLYKIIEKYNLKDESVKLNTIEDEDDFFFLMSFFNAQAKAVEIENFLIKELKCEKISAGLDRGDCLSPNEKYIELKTSTTNKNNFLNIRQIRLYQDVDYYICSFINERNLDKSAYYLLTKEEMVDEVEKCGSYTHGTKKATDLNVNKEYSISFPIYSNNDITNRWNKKYRRKNIEELICDMN